MTGPFFYLRAERNNYLILDARKTTDAGPMNDSVGLERCLEDAEDEVMRRNTPFECPGCGQADIPQGDGVYLESTDAYVCQDCYNLLCSECHEREATHHGLCRTCYMVGKADHEYDRRKDAALERASEERDYDFN
jgi:predicted RNA-binding Zn-ribbon protein involved in translation (DUF1610 family)